MKPLIYSLCTLFFLWGASGLAQTTNTGELYVSPGTVFSTVAEFDNKETGAFINDGDSYMYSHFNNDGSVTYIEDGGYTRFVGTAVQQISGMNRAYFYDALFDNTSADVPFQLSGVISVTREGIFQNGIVDNDDFGGLFVFEQDGFHSGTSDFSHVDGYVLKEGDTNFLYPIGDGGFFRFAAISPPEVLSDFESKYTYENPDPLYPLENKEEHIELIDDAEYWILNRVTGASEVLLTLSWSTATTPFAITNMSEGEANIHIVRWDSDSNRWIDEGGAVDLSSQTVTAAITGYGVFTLALVKDIPDDFNIWNGISANGDGENDFFFLEGIERYPDNNVQVFNRWGVKVFDRNGYDNASVAFTGISNGRVTVRQNERLPVGTYFYVITFGGENPGKKSYSGYLYLQE